jgi:hypothetical protein
VRRRHPVVDLRLAARRVALLVNITSVLVGLALFVNFLGSMQMLQAPREGGYGLGMDVLTAGWWMLPGGVLMALASPLAARLMVRNGSPVGRGERAQRSGTRHGHGDRVGDIGCAARVGAGGSRVLRGRRRCERRGAVVCAAGAACSGTVPADAPPPEALAV